MLILGLDPAQKTGFAYYDTQRSLSAIQAGIIKCAPGRKIPIEVKAGQLGREFFRLLRDKRPDIVAIEEPGRRQFSVSGDDDHQGEDLAGEVPEGDRLTGLASVISSNQIVGGFSMLCAVKNIPLITIPAATWRKHFLGFGRQKGWDRTKWKQASRERCALLKIAVTNDDMADAVGVAFAASASQEFRDLRNKLMEGRAA